MPNPRMLSSLKGLALAASVVLVVVVGASMVLKATVDYLLYWDATAAAENWARYVAENVNDIEQIAKGEQPSAASMAFFIRTQQIRYVFGFEIADLKGNVQLASDGSKISRMRGAVYRDSAEQAALTGQSIVSVKKGTPPVRPEIYAEAYLPVLVDKRPTAIVAAYVDLTEQRDQFRSTFLLAALALFLLGGLGAGVPTYAWHRMTEKNIRADRRIHFYANRLKLALKAADAIVFEYDHAKGQYWLSDELAEMVGPDKTLGVTLHPLSIFAPEDREALRIQTQSIVDGKDTGGIDARLLTLTGMRWMRIYVEVERGEDGIPRRSIGLMIDIDEKKKQELALEEARKAAEAATAAKSNFLASMSHEIRTPLNGVLGMAQSLYGDKLTPAQRAKVSVVLDSGGMLMALLNDVLDLSKIEAGKMDIAPIDGDLRDSVMRVVQLFKPGAEDKGITLNAVIDPDLPDRLSFDPVRVRQCVSNLLSNAIKFTSHGACVDLHCAAGQRPDGSYLVTITVADRGIGMDAETVGRLFSAFTQADGSTSRRFGGSGLGLTISRQLARAMGGEIEVESELGAGSSFKLSFLVGPAAGQGAPLAESTFRDARPASEVRPVLSARILLVDDNPVNRQVVKLFLEPFAHKIHEAANGLEALAALHRMPFDLVLLDVHMPVMDGCDTIRAIRSSPQPWHDLPVIALTADAMTGDRERYLAMGMTDYLSKPIDQRDLTGKIAAALATQRGPV